jgi:hypothetical protein
MRVLAAAVLLLSGCFEVELYFRCNHDSQCFTGTYSGVCEQPAGYCSFPDNTCAGPQRRFGHAPSPWGHQCVGAISNTDAAVSDMPPSTDGGTDGAQQPDDLAITSHLCPTPNLLITVEDQETNGVGEIRRFTIPVSGPVQPCSTLTGSGQLAALPQAVARVGLDRLAVAGSDKVTVIEPSTDTIRATWTTGANLVPIDVAPLDAAGSASIAVGFRPTTAFPPYMSSLVLYREGVAAPVQTWAAATLGLGAVRAITVDPWNASRLMVLDERSPTPQALGFVEPLSAAVTPYFNMPGGIGFHTLAAFSSGAGARIMWAARNTYNGYYTGNDPAGPVDGGSGPYLVGPTQCGGCDMLHAVPDPSDAKRAFVLCDTGGALNSRVVQRATWTGIGMVNGSCLPVFQGNQLRTKQRLTHLAIVM